MQKRWIILGLTLSLVFNVAFLGALGYRMWIRRHLPHPTQEFHRKPPQDRMALRKEQREQLDKLRKDFFPRIRGIRMELVKERETLAALIKEEKPDTSQINRQLTRIGELQCRIEKLVVFQLIQEKAHLDPHQQEVFLKMILRRMGEMGPGESRRRPEHPASPSKFNRPWQNPQPEKER